MFKKSIVEGFSSDISVGKVAAGLLTSLLAAVFILFVYRTAMKRLAPNRGFELTLLLVTAISAMIVLTITSNLALSLGMVGALSIVRFRTAIKDSSDTAFMFWSVAAGITAGAGFYLITIIGCLFIGVVAVVASIITASSACTYLLVVRTESGSADIAEKALQHKNVRRKLSSMVENDSYSELIYEISSANATQKLVSFLKSAPGIVSVSLVDCKNY